MLLCTHYRAPINYTQRALEEASDRAYYIYQTLADADAAVAAAGGEGEAGAPAAPAAPAKAGKKAPPPGPAEEAAAAAAALPAAVSAALSDDLNTPQARAACRTHARTASHRTAPHCIGAFAMTPLSVSSDARACLRVAARRRWRRCLRR
jgi:cysteinyl-tRNA synthetase